ncbi:FecR family protein [Paraburkholderia unamae]|uniref:FecR family protein n=1 Tax=Paraburkholderia unamae TaxID=219649 RepID=UPI001CB37130|nr:FecR domain-containing protein [Paraburkholderia unamae]CAG9248214.1 FecR family protein [Paraburkholderia unamae]
MTKDHQHAGMPDSFPADLAADAQAAARTRRIRAQAAVWIVRIDAGRARIDDARLARWCARSPQHGKAFEAALRQWREADALRAPTHAQSAPAGNITKPRTLAAFRRFAFTAPRAAFAVPFAAVIAAIGIGAALYAHAPDYATAPGELRTLALEDGTIAKLDADSAIDVRYTPNERSIVLARGRAAFEVRHGDPRRFVVHAGGGEIVDIGTAFQASTPSLNPARTGDVLVTVTQGRVAVRNAAGSREAVAGQSVAFGDGDRAPATVGVDLFAATAWQRGRMVFTDAPLGDVVAALNRYWNGHFVYVRGSAAALRVSGNFAVGAPAQALATLAETLRLQSTQIAGRIVILSAPEAAATQ